MNTNGQHDPRREGLTNAEIAAKLTRPQATVERRLKLIRACWKKVAET